MTVPFPQQNLENWGGGGGGDAALSPRVHVEERLPHQLAQRRGQRAQAPLVLDSFWGRRAGYPICKWRRAQKRHLRTVMFALRLRSKQWQALSLLFLLARDFRETRASCELCCISMCWFQRSLGALRHNTTSLSQKNSGL